MPRQSTSGWVARNSAGRRFVASPMTSRLRMKARCRVASDRNVCWSMPAAAPRRYAASYRMWRTKSSGSNDITRLGQDLGSDDRRERLEGDEFDRPSQHVLEQLRKVEEALVGLAALGEAHEHIGVAVRTRLTPCHRPEHG